MNKIKSITFFPNGNTMVFDEQGQQVPELQESWLVLYLKHMESLGYDPTECKDIQGPNGRYVTPFRTDNGWNWSSAEF